MNHIRRGFCLLLWICFTHAVYGAEPVNPDSALVTVLAEIAGQPLSLSEAVEAALAQSTSVQIARAQLGAARGVVQRERGDFDPEAFVELKRTGDDQPTASPFSGATVLKQDETSAQAGVRFRLPIGTELEASMLTIRQESNSNFTALNPRYNTVGSVRFRQPLLEGFGVTGRADLLAAERQLDAAQARHDNVVFSVRAQVARMYWNLYAFERNLAVQMLVRVQAEVLLNGARLRAKAGLVGPNEVANAQVFLAEQQLAALDREEALDGISDDLAAFIGLRPDADVRFHPIHKPPREFDLAKVDDVVADAVSKNIALKAFRADTEVLKTLARSADREKLPTVDLLVALGGAGLSGTGQDVVFGADTTRATATGGYGDALSQVLKGDFPKWEVGVSMKIPIGNRKDRGEAHRLRAEVARADQVYVGAVRDLETQVRAEYRVLEHGAERLAVAREGVAAAQEQVRIGLIEYRNGQTTAFELARLGADFARAQTRYSQALVRMATAAARLQYLTSGQHPGVGGN